MRSNPSPAPASLSSPDSVPEAGIPGSQVTGEYADKASLSQAKQDAQNAVYTVSENGSSKEYTSGSNQVSLGYGKFDVTLKESPSLAKDLISGSSGFAQRAFSAAQSGLNSFARSGIYSMSNYNYMGMFINTYM